MRVGAGGRIRSCYSPHPLSSPARAGLHRPHRDRTLIRDRVDYALHLPYLTAPIHALFVRPMIEKIFAYRREVIARVLS